MFQIVKPMKIESTNQFLQIIQLNERGYSKKKTSVRLLHKIEHLYNYSQEHQEVETTSKCP